MDNPKVSINNLFANLHESWQKHEKKKALAKRRSQRRNSKREGTTSADKTPLFGSLLNQQWNAGGARDKYEAKNAAAMRCFNLLTRDNNARDAPSPVPSTGPSTAANKVSLTGSLSSSIATSIASDDNDQMQDIGSGDASFPEYIPLCEQRRRSEAEALKALRAKLAEIKGDRKPRFKPLLWKKPSFDFPPSNSSASRKDSETSSPSAAIIQAPPASSTNQGKKRKASDEPIMTDCGLDETHFIMPRPLSGAVSISTSTASSLPPQPQYGGSCPYSRRQWTKEEVDGLVNLTNKWIKPGTNNKRRKSENII